VIPALAEEQAIAGAVRNAFAAGADEVVVADGGSSDRTVAEARSAGATVVMALRGRGTQLNAGAAAASGDVLCFLHADVRLAAGGIDAIRTALDDPAVAGGNFRVRFGGALHGRFLAAFYHVIRRLGVYYGDSTLFCRREAFDAVGGFPPFPIMEDVSFVNCLRRRGRMAYLDSRVAASPRRWEHGGIPQVWASWLVIQSLYWCGVSPWRLAVLYRHIR
jgi:rSAM/selenodomain-associated transferase 2